LEDVKIRLAVLWLFKELATLGYIILVLMEPDVIKQIVEKGEIYGEKLGPEILLLFAIIVLVPLVMAFLSLTLKNSANRWANIIVGIVFTVLGLMDLIDALAAPSAHGILMTVSMVVAPALIVWYAYKWPKKKD